jgi:hypothetical protein
MALILFVAAPMMAVSSAAAEPLTLGQWMSAIFSTWSKKVDTAQQGIAAAAPPAPLPQLQASSEPAAPKAPPATSAVPRFWIQRDGARKKVRRRR